MKFSITVTGQEKCY